jgi:urease accessory protein
MKKILLSLALLALGTAPAFAHLDPGEHGSFAAGFTHPIFGLDHVLAMVAVGLWAATVGGRAMIGVPAAFVASMVLGFVLALNGAELPFVEPAILASVVALGFLVALAVRLPLPAGMAIVAAFGLFHGYAHGGEMGAATAFEYGAGFAVATALLHVAGIGLGLLIGRLRGRLSGGIVRALGAATGLAGLWLAFGG